MTDSERAWLRLKCFELSKPRGFVMSVGEYRGLSQSEKDLLGDKYSEAEQLFKWATLLAG